MLNKKINNKARHVQKWDFSECPQFNLEESFEDGKVSRIQYNA